MMKAPGRGADGLVSQSGPTTKVGDKEEKLILEPPANRNHRARILQSKVIPARPLFQVFVCKLAECDSCAWAAEGINSTLERISATIERVLPGASFS